MTSFMLLNQIPFKTDSDNIDIYITQEDLSHTTNLYFKDLFSAIDAAKSGALISFNDEMMFQYNDFLSKLPIHPKTITLFYKSPSGVHVVIGVYCAPITSEECSWVDLACTTGCNEWYLKDRLILVGIKSNKKRPETRPYISTETYCDLIAQIPKINKTEKRLNVDHKTYLMVDDITGYYKIGRTKDPKAREATLMSVRNSLRMIATTDRDIEKDLHLQYTLQRDRGEWFSLSNEDVANILKMFEVCMQEI